MHVLKVITGPASGQAYEVEGETLIGREGAHINLPDDRLSRRHALLHPTGKGVVIEDLGSLNGTYVNGVRIDEPMLITDPATITVGGTQLELGFPPGARELRYSPEVMPELQRTRVSQRESEPARAGVGAEAAVGVGDGTYGATTKVPPQADGQPPAQAPTPTPQPRRSAFRRTKILVLAGIGTLLLAGAAAVAAILLADGGAKNHKVGLHGVVAVITQVGEPGTPGSSHVDAIQITGPPGGDGAGIQRVSIGPGGKLIGTIRVFFATGSITLSYAGRAQPVGGGTFRLKAIAKVTKSTGEFAGASGTVGVIAISRPGAPTSSFNALGTIKY